MLIRKATLNDARAIARIHVDTWRSTYAGLLPERVLLRLNVERQSAIWARSISAASQENVVVAETDARGVVGFVSAGAMRVGPLPFGGEIYTLYVLDDHRGAGVGRSLLNAGFTCLARAGTASALIWVLSRNPTRYFYETMGGRRIGERNEPLWGSIVHQTAYGWWELETMVGGVENDPE